MSVINIVRKRKCMICGGCSGICPQNAIDFEYNKSNGFMQARIDFSKCVNCGLCEKVCPALHQSDSSLLGDYKHIYLTHAAEYKIRFSSTSGGAINSIVNFLINNHIVEAVLMVSFDCTSSIEAKTIIITKDNLHLLSDTPRDFASRYVSVPVLEQLGYIKSHFRKVAVVGTSCQIRSLDLILNLIKGLEIIKIGITCSGGMSYLATKEYKRKMNLNNSKMYYRGNGWPGQNSLVNDNFSTDSNHLGSYFERMFSSYIFRNPGCRNCKDHFAEKADLSFCDFWDQKELLSETAGNSCLIIRSALGEKIISDVLKDGCLCLVRELNEDVVCNTQKVVLKSKKGNLRLSRKFIVFAHLVDFVFRFRIYKFFNYKIYNRFAVYYSNLCDRSDLL